MFSSIFGLFSGTIGKGVLIAASVGVVLAGLKIMVNNHDATVRQAEQSAITVAEQAANIKIIQSDNQRVIAALVDTNQASTALNFNLTQVRKAIDNAPVTNACASSPAIAAALAGLHKPIPTPGH